MKKRYKSEEAYEIELDEKIKNGLKFRGNEKRNRVCVCAVSTNPDVIFNDKAARKWGKYEGFKQKQFQDGRAAD